VLSLSKGAKVKIWSESGNRYFVTTSGNARGWMSKTYVSSGYAMTTTVNVNLRKSANGAVIKTLSAGTKVEVISITGSWSKVKVGSTTGYVYNKYMK
jgi:SH3-like domain-containing protein